MNSLYTLAVMVNISTNINKTNNDHLTPYDVGNPSLVVISISPYKLMVFVGDQTK
jgi:hypothetical protein